MSDRHWALNIFDPHFGHKAAPLPPDIEVPSEDRGSPEPWRPTPTAFQSQLWGWWGECIEVVQSMVGKEPLFVCCPGDVTHGDRARHKDKDLVSDRSSDQIAIAERAFEPLIKMPNVRAFRFTKGTGSHVFGNGDAEIRLARRLKQKDLDAEAWYHIEFEWGGALFDVAHHGPGPGIREWLSGNELRRYVQSIQRDCDKNRRRLPDAVIRGHFHTKTIEHVPFKREGKTDWTWGVIGPGFCGADDYTHKATRSKRVIEVGMLLFEIVGGRIVYVHDDGLMHGIDLARREMF